MNVIDFFETAISGYIDTNNDEIFQAIIGDPDYTPPDLTTVVDSSDFDCGAICNELEYARLVSGYYLEAMTIDKSENHELTSLVQAFIDMSRIDDTEPDENYSRRFKVIAVQNGYPHRTTKWAIRSALSYFIPELVKIQVVEFFDSSNLYFQVRFEGVNNFTDTIFIDQGFIDQDYIGGVGIGTLLSFVEDLIRRIKAAGVDFDVKVISQYSVVLLSDAEIA